ncbi:MAG: hypothetical protein JNK00_00260 [Flavipsychrobacter sp.]|nr:hypothetical protein [Flavipsychrobacter sp.]
MKITRHAFKAARALLDLEQKDIEIATGIPRQRISSFETGNIEIGKKTYDTLRLFFESRGIEFLEHEGVRKKPELQYTILNGTQGFRALMDEVYESARNSDGRIEIMNGQPELFLKWLGEEWYSNHAARMEALKAKINFRIITNEKQKKLIAKKFATYRHINNEIFNTQTIYIYDESVAFFTFTNDDVTIIVMRQPNLIKTLRMMFDLVWEQAK